MTSRDQWTPVRNTLPLEPRSTAPLDLRATDPDPLPWGELARETDPLPSPSSAELPPGAAHEEPPAQSCLRARQDSAAATPERESRRMTILPMRPRGRHALALAGIVVLNLAAWAAVALLKRAPPGPRPIVPALSFLETPAPLGSAILPAASQAGPDAMPSLSAPPSISARPPKPRPPIMSSPKPARSSGEIIDPWGNHG